MTQQWIIYGNDASSWNTALFLQHQIPAQQIQLTLIVPPAKADAGLYLNQTCVNFHRHLGIDERDFLVRTQASIHLSHQFSYWSTPAQNLLLSSTEYGKSHQNIEFFHWLHYAKSINEKYSSENFNLNTSAARLGNFSPLPNKAPLALKTLQHGYQVNENRYCEFLRLIAIQRGLPIIDAEVADKTLPPAGNHSLTVRANTGELRSLSFDFIVSTENIAFANTSPNWQDCRDFIPASTTQTDISPATENPLFSSNRKISSGWESTFHTQRESIVCRHQILERSLSCALGFQSQSWQQNQIALGKASCNLGEIFENSLSTTLRSLFHLKDLFPFLYNKHKATEYNRLVTEDCERLLDLHNAIFFSAGLVKAKTKSFQTRLSLFLEQGLTPQSEQEFITDSSWLVFLAELYQWPTDRSRQLNDIDNNIIKEHMRLAKAHYMDAAKAIPPFSILLNYLSKAGASTT